MTSSRTARSPSATTDSICPTPERTRAPRQRLTAFSFPVHDRREKKRASGRPSNARNAHALPTGTITPVSAGYANAGLRVGGRTALRNKEAFVTIDLAAPDNAQQIIWNERCDERSLLPVVRARLRHQWRIPRRPRALPRIGNFMGSV